MSEPKTSSTDPGRPPPRSARSPTRRRIGLGVAFLVACGIGAGATALAQRGRMQILVPLTPGPISTMKEWAAVAVKGQVTEIFGNKFIIADDSGHALVETGRQGEGGTLVAASETVTVQGRFEHGFVRAVAIQHGDGRTVVLGPPGPPPPRHWPQS